ncbi:hypothetical protein HYV73_00230 [Candidatus Uhrbacteria bacterium]|nr:hypothetical protein [Candidatus Uhrbacteria bacterium]
MPTPIQRYPPSGLPPPELTAAQHHPVLFVLGPLLMFALIGGGWFVAYKLSLTKASSNQAEARRDSYIEKQESIRRLLETVGNQTALPDDEEPTVATIRDLAPLDGKPFFVGAKEGDRVIIYPKANKAILYSTTTALVIREAEVDVTY